MTDVDPRDYMDLYHIRISPPVFAETSTTEDDFDEDEHSLIFTTTVVDEELHVEYTSAQGAEKHVDELNARLDAVRRGALTIRSPYSSDGPDVDGVLMFHPGKR